MKITIKTTFGEQWNIDLTEENTILDVKTYLHANHGIPINTQTIICAGRIIPNMIYLKDLPTHTLYLVITLRTI